MPTMRSEFSVEQIAEALQKLAHELPRFTRVSTEDMDLTFYYDDNGKPRRISVQHHKKTGKKNRWGDPETEYWSFSIEPKMYYTSNHVTKISFASQEDEAKIRELLNTLMANVKPVPRFSLAKLGRQKQLHEQ